MPFITIGNIAQHVSEMEAEILLAAGGKVASAYEAAEAVNRAVYLGDGKMQQVNDDFKRIYSTKESANID